MYDVHVYTGFIIHYVTKTIALNFKGLPLLQLHASTVYKP